VIARHSPRSLNLLTNESRADQREKLHDETGELAGGPSSPLILLEMVFPAFTSMRQEARSGEVLAAGSLRRGFPFARRRLRPAAHRAGKVSLTSQSLKEKGVGLTPTPLCLCLGRHFAENGPAFEALNKP
jgi:hypothetical protein